MSYEVSVLYREPKLLKLANSYTRHQPSPSVSVLYREPKLLKSKPNVSSGMAQSMVSVLYREPKLLKFFFVADMTTRPGVSVLYREPKLLKFARCSRTSPEHRRFSALP